MSDAYELASRGLEGRKRAAWQYNMTDDEWAASEHAVESLRTTAHPFTDGPLPFGKIVDCGLVEYREFACSLETYEWLRGGAMTHVNGEPVTLSIADRPSEHNVIVKAVTPSWLWTPKYVAPDERIAA